LKISQFVKIQLTQYLKSSEAERDDPSFS